MGKVIQIAGRIGSGKTYLATLLTNNLLNIGYSVFRTSFAYSLKKVLLLSGVRKDKVLHSLKSVIFSDRNLTLKQKCQIWYGEFINNTFRVFKDPELLDYLKQQNITEDYPLIMEGLMKYFIENDLSGARLLLQNIGTLLRSYDKNIFVNYTKNQIMQSNADVIIIDDYRYPNEEFEHAFKIKLVNINENRQENIITTHESEMYIDKLNYDLLVIRNNNTYEPDIDRIYNKIAEVVNNV